MPKSRVTTSQSGWTPSNASPDWELPTAIPAARDGVFAADGSIGLIVNQMQ
jgi:hypothetical protein